MLDPFVGSGTTIFTALEHNRNVVGIDMGEDYIDYTRMILESEGHRDIAWEDVEARLNRPSAVWDSWEGNKKNFRKPGGSKKKTKKAK